MFTVGAVEKEPYTNQFGPTQRTSRRYRSQASCGRTICQILYSRLLISASPLRSKRRVFSLPQIHHALTRWRSLRQELWNPITFLYEIIAQAQDHWKKVTSFFFYFSPIFQPVISFSYEVQNKVIHLSIKSQGLYGKNTSGCIVTKEGLVTVTSELQFAGE